MPRIPALVAALALVVAPAAAEEQLLDAIAAQVGSEIVLVSEVMAAAGPVLARAQAAGATPQELSSIQEQALERALIRQVVRRAEMDATDAEIDDAIRGIAQENGIDIDQLRQSVESQGMPYAVYRERIRGEIEHSKVMNGIVASRVRVSDDDLKRRYQEELGDQPTGGTEYFLRHILVTANAQRPQAEACATVAAARERVAAGEAFMQVAAGVSEANPERGGTLGWIHERELAGWMTAPVQALEPGTVSDVIAAPFGCNLIELADRRSYQPVAFEDARMALHGAIFNERMQIEYTRFVEELRSDTYIERKPLRAEAGNGRS